MSGHGYDFDLRVEACVFAHFGREPADDGAGIDHRAEFVARQSEVTEQDFVKVACGKVEHLGCRGHGKFGDSATGEHVYQRVGHEKNLVGGIQYLRTVAAQSIELKQSVEVHELYAGAAVQFATFHMA